MHGVLRALAAGCLAIVAATAARAQTPESFYRGKTVSILMGTGPGGSYDLYGRLVANHLGRFIPGNPSLIVEHMPGAGGAIAANAIYAGPNQDGTKILLSHALPLIEKLQSEGVRFESRKMQWLGAYDQISQMLAIWHTSPGKTIDDLKREPVVLGSMGRSHLSYQWATLLKGALDAPFRVIAGFPSGGELNLAMERGEIAGWTVAWENITGGKQDWLRDRKIVIPVQFTLTRMPELPDVPTLIELSKGESRDIAEFLASGTPHARALAVGPNVPPDRVAVLRAAFDAMVKDPAFLEEAKKRNLAIGPRSAAEVQALTEKIVDASPEFITRVKAAVGALQ
ncbi:MAG: efflux transporter protein [Hyphomicrobiales bacterium]|nr:efflux transporter protein [Hyphomicrobiales bacterium]